MSGLFYFALGMVVGAGIVGEAFYSYRKKMLESLQAQGAKE